MRQERPWFRVQKATSWPPYNMLNVDIEAQARARLDKLERLYHKGQDHVWDGREVLGALIEKHGKPVLPEAKKEAALKLLSILLWGELAAWAISADLAERIEDVEAKMAATSQAHDEARHFYVLRDYLAATGEVVPPLGGVARSLLITILETDSLVHKLVGMQLLVESNALSIFRALADAELEPVLTDLMPYYEKDEARHVGLGVMYLPKLLAKMTKLDAARMSAFQLRCVGLLIVGGLPLRKTFRALGMEPRKMAARTVRLQNEILHQMRTHSQNNGFDKMRGMGGLMNPGEGVGPTVLDFIHPPNGEESVAPLHRAVLSVMTAGARWADKALA
jgi:hypothetical protein